MKDDIESMSASSYRGRTPQAVAASTPRLAASIGGAQMHRPVLDTLEDSRRHDA